MLRKVGRVRFQLNSRLVGLAVNGVLVLLLGGVVVGLLVVQAPFGGQVELTAGEVAQQDVVAPRRITYESAVLTQEARERAAQAVPDYYDPPQSRVRRIQVNRAREVLDFIDSVRADTFLGREQQIEALVAIEDLKLSRAMAERVLALDENDWQQAKQEVPLVLDQIMREEIRETSLAEARRRASALVSPDLNEEAGAIVSQLVQALIRPNSFLNPERTEQQRADAREAVPVQVVTLEQGEVVLRAGDIVTPEDVEALEQMGLSQAKWSWWALVQASLITLGLLAVMGGAIHRLRPQTLYSRQETAFLVLVILLGMVVAKLMITPQDWLPYLFPLAAFGMLIALLLDLQIAVVVLFCFGLVIADLSRGNVHLIFYSSVGSLLSVFVLGKAERLSAFLWAGLALIVSNLALTAAFWSQGLAVTTAMVLEAATLSLLNGLLAVSIALIGYFVLGNLFGITTNLQLMELSRPTHPLLRQLLLKAPGTYHHTILVSNLAERAAEAIGADAFLIRVGAYYHDIGKIVRPYFFAENISDGDGSPHAGLDPKTSAQIIISHVKDGIDLARKYRLPQAIQDFIRQHHGAQVMSYFYRKAQEQSNGEPVDAEEFRYPGPDPQTKESAIMMLADTCEAAVRAERPASRADLESLVDRLIAQRVTEGALDASPLTFHELQVVKQVFVQVLQGVHHPRVRYPGPEAGGPEGADNRAEEVASSPAASSTNGRTTSPGVRHMRPQEPPPRQPVDPTSGLE